MRIKRTTRKSWYRHAVAKAIIFWRRLTQTFGVEVLIWSSDCKVNLCLLSVLWFTFLLFSWTEVNPFLCQIEISLVRSRSNPQWRAFYLVKLSSFFLVGEHSILVVKSRCCPQTSWVFLSWSSNSVHNWVEFIVKVWHENNPILVKVCKRVLSVSELFAQACK